ncbi:terminase [Cronobacter sakazakii]|uniref:Putative terminase endonuclease subunit n=1 Tax=Cronobacter phage ESSI-2 TaxID=947842 RepID=F1BUM0_9CAUD|nr:phage terminase small subunit [Cronobacter sakazakii]YP_009792316.1 terminase small subunit [Cronobacter phage ESSI-2]ADX32384.1 putative terminase endonuclease subunit [Cronobacter phage ESSI-2]KAB0913088.1 terminase [Cronobacter sakazakii]KAB0933332.1 terminase [Cronobacter sakazakii]KAB0961593.1 terminase [Cronobacter sakazakii]KAB1488175.1 terminase [Cronobacter sakazakii]
MALSPAQRHSQRIAMEQQLLRREAVERAESLHLQIQALNNDVAHVRNLPTIADREAYKRDVLLPKWVPTVESYLSGGQVYANPVFAWCVVWLFDAGDFEKALAWADIAIEQQQPTPENIRSHFPAFVADTVLNWAEATAAAGESVEPYFSQTFEKVTQCWRLHEQITAKWFKFAGLMMLRDDEGQPRATALDDVETLEKADALLASAEKLYKRVGVGTMRAQIGARIRSLTK